MSSISVPKEMIVSAAYIFIDTLLEEKNIHDDGGDIKCMWNGADLLYSML